MQRHRLATTAVAAVAGLAALVPLSAGASSHREAPLIAGDPQVDNTDVYAFVSPDDANSVTLIANWIPFEEPNGGPNFFAFATDAAYDINIDNTGSAKPNQTYRWTFTNHYRSGNTFLYNTGVVNKITDPTLNFYQTYNLDEIDNGGAPRNLISNGLVAPSNVGAASMPNYAALRDGGITAVPGGGRSFAGQADDPFFLDLRVFDFLYGGNLKEVGHDTLAGYNVNSLALQLPKSALAKSGDGSNIVGVWSTTSRKSLTINPDGTRTATGNLVQVSRLGNPLVNEVVVPVGAKDLFNASQPSGDSQFAAGVKDPEVPRLIQSIYNIPAPAAPRNDLVSVFLTGVAGLNQPPKVTASEELRLNMATPSAESQGKPENRLGVLGKDTAGFPNGRRLADDVVDIELQALEGALLPNHPAAVDSLGDGVNANDAAFGTAFPYLALPHTAAVNQSATVATGAAGVATVPNTGTGSGAVAPSGATAGGGGTAVLSSRIPLVLPVGAGAIGLLLMVLGVGALRRRQV